MYLRKAKYPNIFVLIGSDELFAGGGGDGGDNSNHSLNIRYNPNL